VNVKSVATLVIIETTTPPGVPWAGHLELEG